MLQNVTLTAGQTYRVRGLGDFFRILQAADPVTVRFYYDGGAVDEAEDVGAGYRTSFRGRQDDRFNDLEITSATTQDLQFVAQFGGDVAYDAPPTGEVIVTGEQSAFSQAAAAVTNASGQLLAANAARRYLAVQNKDAAGYVYLCLDGAAATVARGIKIPPGGLFELAGFATSAAVTAIGDIANNPNVVVVEG